MTILWGGNVPSTWVASRPSLWGLIFLVYGILKGKNVHTCNNSELDNVVIVHRAEDNSWIFDQMCCMSN